YSNEPTTTGIHTLSLHDALPILTEDAAIFLRDRGAVLVGIDSYNIDDTADLRRPVHTILLGAGIPIVEHMRGLEQLPVTGFRFSDRKSTRLNSSHVKISYAVFCL